MYRKKVATLLVTTLIAFSSNALASEQQLQRSFTPEQEEKIGKIAGEYLLAHPEILVQVSQKLQAQQQAKAQLSFALKVMEQQRALLLDPETPVIGPDNAKVAIIEFFDYQCVHCSHLAPTMEAVMKESKDVRFIFKEWPIFADRWPASEKAAIRGLEIWKQKGADAYMRYHNGIFRTGHDEGKLTDADIQSVSAAAGFVSTVVDTDRSNALTRNDELAQSLGLTGTPGLIVMPVKNATPETITVFPGRASADQLKAAIAKAQ